MAYASYILGILIIGLLCILMIRYWTGKQEIEAGRRRSVSSRRVATHSLKGNRGNSAASSLLTQKILHRETQRVPTPWGWPGHVGQNGTARPDISDVMRSFTNRLIRQKELVNGSSVNPRVSSSVRALLQDRYGPTDFQLMKSIRYEKVKAPLLRDPNAPIDQMDSFGMSELKPNKAKLQKQAAMKTNPGKPVKLGKRPDIDLKDIKLPWGW